MHFSSLPCVVPMPEGSETRNGPVWLFPSLLVQPGIGFSRTFQWFMSPWGPGDGLGWSLDPHRMVGAFTRAVGRFALYYHVLCRLLTVHLRDLQQIRCS